MESISFDRAAGFYDQTRGFPPGISDRVADSAASAIEPGARVLEIGIGTGRISKPLLSRGYRLAGIDISPRMMERLLASLPTDHPAPLLAQADAAYLPFRSGSFTAVLAVHVFHLIAGWRTALDEVRRVLIPGGFLLTGYGWRPPDSPAAELGEKWKQIRQNCGSQRPRPGVQDFAEVNKALHVMGASLEEWDGAEWMDAFQIGKHIDAIENGIYSSTWQIPPEDLTGCIAELRSWAVGRFGSLDQTIQAPRKFIWQRYHWDHKEP